MSALVDRALDRAGLSDVIAARRAGSIGAEDAARLRGADLLALGALADRVREEEVGDEVVIYSPPTVGDAEAAIVLPGAGAPWTGLDLLRAVALARVTGPARARVRVDWSVCGLELAQVALGFGANELCGHLTSKRGLLIAEGELLGVGKKSRLQPASAVKRAELEGFVRRAGRTPTFRSLADPADGVDGEAPGEESSSAGVA